ncbi:MAG: hypothetical protein QOK02_2008 [Mycobacterium sp.]|jgi:hypothetical protein|nr:hypothetical protein [Mycobacterium sp.]
MNNTDETFRPGLILSVLVAGVIGIGVICAVAPVDPGPAIVPAVEQSTLR